MYERVFTYAGIAIIVFIGAYIAIFFAALDSMYRERGLWVYGRDER